jgi:hypothetical protein
MNRFSSWPGLTRPSTSFLGVWSKDVDARRKAGHDEIKEGARYHWLQFESDSENWPWESELPWEDGAMDRVEAGFIVTAITGAIVLVSSIVWLGIM